jgi:hypothetical protein
LQWRYADFLPNRHRGKRSLFPILDVPDKAADFGRKLNRGPLAETQAFNVFSEAIVAEPLSDLDGSHVRGILNNFRDAKQTVGVVVSYGSPPESDRAVLAIDDFVGRSVLFERRGNCHYLKGRTRLIRLANDCP